MPSIDLKEIQNGGRDNLQYCTEIYLSHPQISSLHTLGQLRPIFQNVGDTVRGTKKGKLRS